MTEAQFKSGELTYALNNGLDKAVWFQTINTQAYPQFSGDTVYKTSPCVSYTNDSAKTNKPHVIGDDDKCKVCGERGIPKRTAMVSMNCPLNCICCGSRRTSAAEKTAQS